MAALCPIFAGLVNASNNKTNDTDDCRHVCNRNKYAKFVMHIHPAYIFMSLVAKFFDCSHTSDRWSRERKRDIPKRQRSKIRPKMFLQRDEDDLADRTRNSGETPT